MRHPAPLLPNRRPHLVAAAVCFWLAGRVGVASAQAGSTPGRAANVGDSMGQVILWCGVLLLAAVVLAVAFFVIRKRLASMDEDSPVASNPLGFTLADLRQMHAEGQISDQEFDFAKRKMVAKAKAQLDGPVDPDDEPEFLDLGDGEGDASDPDEPRD